MPHLKIDDNQRLHYQCIQGDITKPCLVFLHEGLGSIALWGDYPDLLCRATGCPGLVYDRLGYGKSSPLHLSRTIHYLHKYALLELPILIESVIPDTPYVLIGHSDGGSISLILGAEKPSYLRGIIAEAAHVFVDDETIVGIGGAKTAWTEGKLEGLVEYHGEKTENIFKAWSETWLAEWFHHWNIEYLLPSIDVPLLVIQGDNDQYGRTDQAIAIASKTSGDVHLEIVENCAHVPHMEAQPVVLRLMSDFIVRLTQGQ
ncbi:MAG: alpha/beta hydrolase [Desulforhopalus sp.]